MRSAELVVQVTCLHCRPKSILSNQELGVALSADCLKQLRCNKCGSFFFNEK